MEDIKHAGNETLSTLEKKIQAAEQLQEELKNLEIMKARRDALREAQLKEREEKRVILEAQALRQQTLAETQETIDLIAWFFYIIYSATTKKTHPSSGVAVVEVPTWGANSHSNWLNRFHNGYSNFPVGMEIYEKAPENISKNTLVIKYKSHKELVKKLKEASDTLFEKCLEINFK